MDLGLPLAHILQPEPLVPGLLTLQGTHQEPCTSQTPGNWGRHPQPGERVAMAILG